jgi:hypothetical protein
MRFTATEMHMLHGCFRALLPPEALELPLVGFQIWVERLAPARVAWGLRGVLLYLRLRCLLAGRPWGRRRVTEHRALFEEMRTSSVYLIREMPVMLKALGAFAAFGHPDTQRAFGLPVDTSPPFWARPDQRWERRGTGSGGVGGAEP